MMDNKKNILFFTFCRYSHIIQLKELICELNKKHNVYILSSIEYKDLIEKYRAKFIEYPFDTKKMINKEKYMHKNKL